MTPYALHDADRDSLDLLLAPALWIIIIALQIVMEAVG